MLHSHYNANYRRYIGINLVELSAQLLPSVSVSWGGEISSHRRLPGTMPNGVTEKRDHKSQVIIHGHPNPVRCTFTAPPGLPEVPLG